MSHSTHTPAASGGWRFHEDGSLPPAGPEWVFVFGSNLAGRHGAGAALVALERYGAVRGVGEGLQGRSYGIATKGARLDVLDLNRIASGIARFIEDARAMPERLFFVTRVGCGLAGYQDRQIAPLFRAAPGNCSFPATWHAFLTHTRAESGGEQCES